MKKQNLFVRLVFLIALPLLLTACAQFFTISQLVPDEGKWFCADLSITIDLDAGYSVAVINDSEVFCDFSNDRGSDYVSINCQDVDSQYFYLGESVFEGRCIYYDETTMIIVEEPTNIQYRFRRQD